MKKVVQPIAHRIHFKSNSSESFTNRDSFYETEETVSQESKLFSQIPIHKEGLTDIISKIEKYQMNCLKNCVDLENIQDSVKKYCQDLSKIEEGLASQAYSKIALYFGHFQEFFANWSEIFGNFIFELKAQQTNFSIEYSNLKQFHKRDEKVKSSFDSADNKLRSYQIGKVKLEKLEELEQERNEAKQKVLSYADETISNLNRLHSQYIWETLEKFFSLLETCGGVFQKENMFLSEEMEKDMKSMKETLETHEVFKKKQLFSQKSKRARILPTIGKNRSDSSSKPTETHIPPDFIESKMAKICEFEVEKMGKGVKRTKRILIINLNGMNLFQRRTSEKDAHTKVRHFSNITKIVKSKSNGCKLKIYSLHNWAPDVSFSDDSLPKKVKQESVIELFLFKSAEQRERFYEYGTYILRKLKDLHGHFSEEFKIFIGTWNMGDAAPPDSLDGWIPKLGYDIYAISTQECEYSPRGKFNSPEQDWFSTITDHLGSNFIKVESISLWSIRLIVFIRREHYHKLSFIQKKSEATGIGNVMGNKGGVGICFYLHETSICFIGCHLAAHQNEVEARNTNFKDIVKNLKFKHIRLDKKSEQLDLIHQFDYIFWCGDLNYRINLERDQVLKLLENNSLGELLVYDQLQQEMKENRVFTGFYEGAIFFNPTYRYNRGTRVYNPEKNRIPSWCDRILYHSLPCYSLTPIEYSASDRITTSDHSPIYATFSLIADFPNIPIQTSPCIISFSSLGCDNLFAKEISNWTIYFLNSFLDGNNASATCKTNQNPYWNESEIPKLFPITHTLSFLKRQCLRVLIECNEEEIGQALIPLDKACQNTFSSSSFSVPICLRGAYQGDLNGTVQVHYQYEKGVWRQSKSITRKGTIDNPTNEKTYLP